MTSSVDLYVYKWSTSETPEKTFIKLFGVTQENKSVYVKVEDYSPYCYVELPTEIEWTDSRIRITCDKLSSLGRKAYQPITKEFVMRKKLYFAWKEEEKDETTNEIRYVDKLFPFILFSFCSTAASKSFSYQFKKPINIEGIGLLKFNIHEAENIDCYLKLMAM